MTLSVVILVSSPTIVVRLAFERLRRITGYLVGSLDRWNDGKKAEEHDRVKHGVHCNKNGVYSKDEKSSREAAKRAQKSMTGKK